MDGVLSSKEMVIGDSSTMPKTTGYGVMTNNQPMADQEDSTDGFNSKESSSHHNESVGVYGSLDNTSVSTTDSYNRWYYEGFGTDNEAYSGSDANTQQNSYYGYRRQSTFLGSEAGSGYYGETGSLVEHEGLLTLNSNRINRIDGYVPHGEDTEGEQNLIRNSLERRITGVASTPLVAWNLINLLLSTSLLVFPFIVQNGGYFVLPIVIVVAFILNYTSRILISLMYEKSNMFHGRKIRVRLDYLDLSNDVFNSSKGATFVQMVQVIEMLAICVLNICVLGQLGQEITKKSKQVCTVVAALFTLPTFFIKKLVIIGWMQTVGVIALVLGLGIVQGYCLVYAGSWKASNIPVLDLKYIPIAVGVAIYAYGIQGIMPGLEEQMKKPKKFGFVVNMTFSITFIVQCLFGVSNAMFYGNKTDQVIIVDLDNHFALGVTTACFFGISILSHFSLPTLVVMEKLDNAILQTSSCCPKYRQKFHAFLQAALRIGVMALSVGIALAVPYFAYLMAFVGSAITIFPSLLLPVMFHLKLRYDSLSLLELVVDIIILILGVLCLGTGCYFSFEAIYYDITKSGDFFVFN